MALRHNPRTHRLRLSPSPASMQIARPRDRSSPVAVVSEGIEKDALIAWLRGEFAAANAMIDALCSHLVNGGAAESEYGDVFAAIHRRRLNWVPALHMQRYYSVADVATELQKVAAKKAAQEREDGLDRGAEEVEEDYPNSDVTDAASD